MNNNIKCTNCHRTKPPLAFSTKQRQKPKHIIECKDCNRQVVELTCKMCDITKGKDRFSDNERRKGDKEATCRRCMRQREEEGEVNGEEEEGSRSSEEEELQGGGTRVGSISQGKGSVGA